MPLFPADPDYYFRVDSLVGLRTLSVTDHMLRPARWDNLKSPWKHKTLLTEKAHMLPGEAIYRMSFWINEPEAQRDLAVRGTSEGHLLLRVKRSSVTNALVGWTSEDDDFLVGKADLIWHRQAAADGRFCPDGVPLEHFEVLQGGFWCPWSDAQKLQPDSVRMASIGWQPIPMVTSQGGPVLGYWRVEQHRRIGERAALWCLLTLDTGSLGNLGSEKIAVSQAVNTLLSGPLEHVSGAIFGVLTVNPDNSGLWNEQYSVERLQPAKSSWKDRLSWRGAKNFKPSWKVNPRAHLSKQDELALIRTSGLRNARPEYSQYIWG